MSLMLAWVVAAACGVDAMLLYKSTKDSVSGDMMVLLAVLAMGAAVQFARMARDGSF